MRDLYFILFDFCFEWKLIFGKVGGKVSSPVMTAIVFVWIDVGRNSNFRIPFFCIELQLRGARAMLTCFFYIHVSSSFIVVRDSRDRNNSLWAIVIVIAWDIVDLTNNTLKDKQSERNFIILWSFSFEMIMSGQWSLSFVCDLESKVKMIGASRIYFL